MCWGSGRRGWCARSAAGHGPVGLLDHPAGAVGVAERQERVEVGALRVGTRPLLAVLEVKDVAYVHPPPAEFLPRGLDIGHDELQAIERAGGILVSHEGDRA